MEITGKPEGRQGVWLITPEEATRIVSEFEFQQVHNFIGDGMFIGADWDKCAVIDLLRSDGATVALIFEPNFTMKHQLVVINNQRRWMFDIGVIPETAMKISEGVAA